MDAAALGSLPDDIDALKTVLLAERALRLEGDAKLVLARAWAEDEAARAARVEAEFAVAKAKASDDAALIAHQRNRSASRLSAG